MVVGRSDLHVVSGLARVAGSHDPSRGGLSGYSHISARRAVRAYLPNSQIRSVSAGQYCRGARTGADRIVHSVFADISGVIEGSRNAFALGCAGRSLVSGRSGTVIGSVSNGRAHASRPDPLARGQAPMTFGHSPLATRHSRLRSATNV